MSIANLSAGFTVASIVDALLPQGTKDKGLYISLDLRQNIYTEDDNGHGESRDVHLVFLRPHGSTRVFSCVDNSWQMPDPADFRQTSNHDSCWRSSGLEDIDQASLDMLKKLREAMRDEPFTPTEFSVIRSLHYIKAETKVDPGPKNTGNGSYWHLLTKLEKLEDLGHRWLA